MYARMHSPSDLSHSLLENSHQHVGMAHGTVRYYRMVLCKCSKCLPARSYSGVFA